MYQIQTVNWEKKNNGRSSQIMEAPEYFKRMKTTSTWEYRKQTPSNNLT